MKANTIESVLMRRKRDAHGCMIWQGALRHGYGHVSYKNKPALVHRLVFEYFHGPIPAGLCVLHRCDVPACSEPTHLFAGTSADNVHDAVRKGRHAKMVHTHCPKGHEYTPENTRYRSWRTGRNAGKVSKFCAECYRADQRAYKRLYRKRVNA
jgi:hypothetical protein